MLAAALVGWNPLFAIHFAGGGHNDSLLMAATLGALALAAAGRRQPAGATGRCDPGQVDPLASRCARSRPARLEAGRSPRFRVTAALVSLSRRGHGFDWLRSASPLARNVEEQSSYCRTGSSSSASHRLTLALAGRARSRAAWLARRRGRRRPPGPCRPPFLATTPWLTPWYAIWALPLAAAEDDRSAQLIALAFCAYLLPQAIPF